MYHFGLNVGETDDDLRAVLATVHKAGATVVGASDHTVTHSLYILDPDGNEIELYVDVPGVDWQSDPTLVGAADPPAPALTGRPRRRSTVTETVRIVHADERRRAAPRRSACVAAGSSWSRPTPSTGWRPDPADADAVRAVYRVKGRPEGMHLPVLAASLAQVRALGVAFTPGAEALARRWWPGPLTLAFGFEPGARPAGLAGRARRRWRCASPTTTSCGRSWSETGVLVVTSANPHGAPTPRTAHDVAACLGSSVDLVVDGGQLARRALDAGQRARPRAGGRARGRDHRGPPSWPRLAAGPVSRHAAGHRDVVRRDGGRRRRRDAMRCARPWWPARSTSTPRSAGSSRSWPAAPTSRR